MTEEIIDGVRKKYIDQVLKENPDLFKGAQDIHWKDHVKMQACLQEHVDSAISKTINMPNSATVEDVKDAYELAWKLGCKGLTIYRSGSRDQQVLTTNTIKGKDFEQTEGITIDNACPRESQGVQSGTRREETRAEVCDRRDPYDTGGYTPGTPEVKSRGACPDKVPQQHEQRIVEAGGESGDTQVRSTGRGDVRPGQSEGSNSTGTPEDRPDLPTPFKLELPDMLKSTRYRVRDKNGDKVYFVVCTMDDQPVEVFARLPLDTQDSYWNTICRLISLNLRYNVPLKDVCKQLSKSSSAVSDTPARLARILDEYQVEDEVGEYTKDPCPECGEYLVPSGGCLTCYSCGWSKCS